MDRATVRARLTVKNSSRQYRPGWETGLRTNRRAQHDQWVEEANRRDRRAHYNTLLAQELRRAYRLPMD